MSPYPDSVAKRNWATQLLLERAHVHSGRLPQPLASILVLAARAHGAVLDPDPPGGAPLAVARSGCVCVAASLDGTPPSAGRFVAGHDRVVALSGSTFVRMGDRSLLLLRRAEAATRVAADIRNFGWYPLRGLLVPRDRDGSAFVSVDALCGVAECPPDDRDAAVVLAVEAALRDSAGACVIERSRDDAPSVPEGAIDVLMAAQSALPLAGPVAALGGYDVLVSVLPGWIAAAMRDGTVPETPDTVPPPRPDGIAVAANGRVAETDPATCPGPIAAILRMLQREGRKHCGLVVAGPRDARHVVALWRRGVVRADAFDAFTGERVRLASIAAKAAA